MFKSIADFSTCIRKHNTVVPKDILDILFEHLDDNTDTEDFVKKLSAYTKRNVISIFGFIDLNDFKPKFSGEKGAIFF